MQKSLTIKEFRREAEIYILGLHKFMHMYNGEIDVSKYKMSLEKCRGNYLSDANIDFIYRILGIKNTNAVKKAIQFHKAAMFSEIAKQMMSCQDFRQMKILANTLLKRGYINNTIYGYLVEFISRYDAQIKSIKDIDNTIESYVKGSDYDKQCKTVEDLFDKMLSTSEGKLKFSQYGIKCNTHDEAFSNLDAMGIFFDWLALYHKQIPSDRVITNEINNDNDLQNYFNLKDNKYQLNLQAGLCAYTAPDHLEGQRHNKFKNINKFRLFISISQYPSIVGRYMSSDADFGQYLERMLFDCSIQIPLDTDGNKYYKELKMNELFDNKKAFNTLVKVLGSQEATKLLRIKFDGTEFSKQLNIRDKFDSVDFVELTCKYRIRMCWIMQVMLALDKIIDTKRDWDHFYFYF